MTMRGFEAGDSQRSTWSKLARRRLMQPFVGLPVCTCRKIPEPRRGTTGLMLNSTTARYAYARGDFDMSGVVTLNGGLRPQPTRWNVLRRRRRILDPPVAA